MMKKVLCALLAVLILLSLCACGKPGKPASPNNGPTTPATGNSNTTPAEKETKPALPENWGVEDMRSISVDQNLITVHFSWPAGEGLTAGTGCASDQWDGTWVMVDGYVVGTSPEDVDLKDFYPAYIQQTKDALADYYGSRYKNGEITVGEGVLSTIGEYEVCKYSGKHVYEFSGKTYEHPFVVYATTVKGNGAIIYWMVQDVTEDHSAGKQVEENATRIILSIWERKYQ